MHAHSPQSWPGLAWGGALAGGWHERSRCSRHAYSMLVIGKQCMHVHSSSRFGSADRLLLAMNEAAWWPAGLGYHACKPCCITITTCIEVTTGDKTTTTTAMRREDDDDDSLSTLNGGVLCLCAYLARTRQRAAVAIEMENGIGAGLHANLILIPTVLLVPAR
jgi:hypothetical protein